MVSMVNIKVAVRIRPLSHREEVQGEEIVVRKENKSVVVVNPKIPERQDGDSRQRSHRFSVDFCYDPQDPQGSTQEAVYKEIGPQVLDSLLEGYNACILAYGHSASGKTYTIMGFEDDPGLTPRLCQGLFGRTGRMSCEESIGVEVSASFLEIYNEKVKDLLASEEAGGVSSTFPLRVREHPKSGPYVQGLSEHLVTDQRALLHLLAAGNRKRSTAATENNSQSSRSHAVFTIHLRQNDGDNCSTQKWSKVHLVDLAGSLQEISLQEPALDERASSAQSKTRLQEGANINKSLVTLGYVISALAESWETSAASKEHPPRRSWHPFVPYRDSVLTWLLKDTLGGNSKTIMIATVSPASGCLSETVNTLRYAKRTKRIVNEAVVNEDPKVRTIRELRKEVARLKGLLVSFQSVLEGGQERWSGEGAMRGGGRRSGTALPRRFAAEVGDGKEPVVNGSTNDTFSHESEIFSDSLESLGSGFVRRGVCCEGESEAGCCEKWKRMHRSRPDLIKGISGHLKERPPSSGSQSCADVSNLSQSTSDNSATSSASLDGRGGREKEWSPEVHSSKKSGEVEESKLCKRARMKLFDLRRKLGMTRRLKRTVDSDTQTDTLAGTIRVKEKCVETEPGGSLEEEATTRPPAAIESATQTPQEEKSDKSANTSPSELSPRDEEWFSEDSLELEKESDGRWVAKYLSCLRGGDGKQKARDEERGLPSKSRPISRRDENLSSDGSFASAEGAELISSSEVSSEDFVFFENPKEDSGVEATTRERELYTITENSEQSDAGDASQAMNGDGRGRKWRERELEGEEEWEGAWKGGEKVGKAKKMKWSDRQSSCERQYLNLNVSAGSRSPFSIDSHLFGKKQSSDGMFTSADSVTLVLMGPAKPKSSVLMEIIKRSLARKGQLAQRKWKSRGVQCDENLVRSVSVDMAMIALSRIARNEQQPGNIVRAASLDGMDATPPDEKASGSRSPLHPNGFGTQQKKSALKSSLGTEPLSHRHAGDDVRQQKKSVSWSGDTTYDVHPEESPAFHPHNEPSRVPRPPDDLAIFLKEAIHLLRKINSGSKEGDVDAHTDAQDKVDFLPLDRANGGSNFNSTWPRRRGTEGKPPTGIRARLGRSVNCSGLLDGTRTCEKVRSWCAEEMERKVRSHGEGDRDATVARTRADSVSEAERRLEKCSRRLELAAEQDELREKLAESRKAMKVEEEPRWEAEDEWESWRKEVRKGMKRRKGGLCSGECNCTASARDPCKRLLRKGCQSSFELDSFGPGSKHCHQMCMFCRKKELELYSSAINLNSECFSEACRLEYYGYCPCSTVRLSHVAWSPRAYMQHLLSLRREIVGRMKGLESPSLRVQPFC